MAIFKWFARIEALEAEDAKAPKGPLSPFDLTVLRPRSLGARLVAALSAFVVQRVVPPALRVCQAIWPIPVVPFLNLVVVTRNDDVRAVLTDAETFGVPYGPEMRDLGAGTTFALGLDGEGHRRQREIMKHVLWADDSGERYFDGDLERVTDCTARFAEALIENGAGRIDVVRDFITRIATETAAVHFGLDIDDPDAFAEWSLASSCLLFGDPLGTRVTRDVGLNGAARLRGVLRASLARARRDRAEHPASRGCSATVIDRLVQLQHERAGDQQPIEDAEIVALLLGMVTGFVPTNTLAAAKILAELMARPDALARAKAAAVGGERDTLRRIVKEAARLNSALAPGQWRVVRKDGWIAAGERRRRKVTRGTVVLASTMTALRDPQRFADPNRFRTDRADDGDLMFGHGPHACMGARMAIEQITSMFMVLLAQPNLRPARDRTGRRMDYLGAFPVRFDMTYDHSGATQSMFLIVAPAPPAARAQIDARLKALGNPAGKAIRDCLDATCDVAGNATGIVHFASLTTIESERGVDIVGEFSVDGEAEPALAAIAAAAGSLLRPIFALAGLAADGSLEDFLRAKLVRLHGAPWGATGLDFNGTPEFPVRAIGRQRALAAQAGEALQEYLERNVACGTHPMRALTHVRRIIRGDRYLRLQTHGPAPALIAEAHKLGLDAFVLKPSRASLKLADYRQPTYMQALWRFVRDRAGLVVTAPLVGLFVAMAARLWLLLPPPPPVCMPAIASWPPLRCTRLDWSASFGGAWRLAAIFLGAVVATLVVVALPLGIAVLILRRRETTDRADPAQVPLARLERIVAAEDHPGCAQNHFIAVGRLKPGLFRTLAHAFALWAIKMIIGFYYRPGFVLTMGTIHYARWWRLPGTRTVLFHSNYDGSWQSYLEDFIARARWGQTAVWSNWIGFPETRYLAFKGAEDGDRFKRWVRTQQRVASFWYSRYPDLTADQIRENALIHHGLARARTEPDAQAWLSCFGSMPRPENRIETHEIQSLLFRGMRPLEHSTCLAITLPSWRHNDLGRWLGWIGGVASPVRGDRRFEQLRRRFPRAFVRDGAEWRLDPQQCLTFGDRQVVGAGHPLAELFRARADDRRDDGKPGRPRWQHAAFFGCSAAGFRKLAQHPERDVGALLGDLLDSFPPAFRMGMAKRPQILGDSDAAAPAKWRWRDAATDHGGAAAEAVLLLYAATPAMLAAMVRLHEALLAHHGGAVLHRRLCAPGPKGMDYEHFGFRDGLSQPVIRGSERFARGVPARDVVEPGEFILGYASNQGFVPPSPVMPPEGDRFARLPVVSDEALSRFPDFGAGPSAGRPRDFGRNGSYLVLREIVQDTATFDAFAREKAAEIQCLARRSGSLGQHSYRELFRLDGQEPDARWIKAKLIGRWPDGRSLVGNPSPTVVPDERVGSTDDTALDNDFAYGVDDPQGFACPLGAHVRRANPRDSREPGDATEQAITNRHRLLRRGRSYTDRGEKGLLFIALCADIERQFEFIQQTWINSPAFHGLSGEPDPLVGAEGGTAGNFSIPTPAGPIRLTALAQFTRVAGGGYFFLPSRSALAFLADLGTGLAV